MTLEIPESLYRALAEYAASVGGSPHAVGATLLIDAIERLPGASVASLASPETSGLITVPVSTLKVMDEGPVSPPADREDLSSVDSPRQPSASYPHSTSQRLKIMWEGSQSELRSFALVDRELCAHLSRRDLELSLISPDLPDPAARPLPGQTGSGSRLPPRSRRPTDVHVRHGWPPSFAPPSDGHWVIMHPWEFGSLPRSWVGPMTESVDEVWVYTRFLRDCCVHSGVPADQVHVVPLGVDPLRFHLGAKPFPLKTTKPLKFLFVGGTVHRKGIDILLNAYEQSFTASDPVCLVIKDLGGATYYRGQTAEERIGRLQERPGAPEIEYLAQELSGDEVASLYTACDCLVHPYRAEGFALPIAEAMACGLAVIVTNYGAALDYCTPENAYLIPAGTMQFKEKRIGNLETVDYPWIAEPDTKALGSLLRAVVDGPAEARAKGSAASAFIRGHLTWDHAVDVIESRLDQLRKQPIRRFAAGEPATVVVMGSEPISKLVPKDSSPISRVSCATGANPIHRPRVSLCMIVKNEEATLASCLASVADLVDEMIVVDTGSTDLTRSVASQAGACVVEFEWVDDFSAARNESIRQATGDWIFWLDADERVDETNREKLRGLLSRLKHENAAYLMQQLSTTNDPYGSLVAVDQVRLFRRDPAIRWEYRVHEQLLLSIRRAGHDLRRTEIVITHLGYQGPDSSQRKLGRNLPLLERQAAERPDDPITWYQLGLANHRLGRADEALRQLLRSLELVPVDYSIRPRLFATIARAHQSLGRQAEALSVCRAGREHYPDVEELLFLEASLLLDQGDAAGAEARLLCLLRVPSDQQLAAGDTGRRGYKARHLLAESYLRQGRRAEAEAQWRFVVEEHPRFLPAWRQLGELYRAEGRWAELDGVTDALARESEHEASALNVRAK